MVIRCVQSLRPLCFLKCTSVFPIELQHLQESSFCFILNIAAQRVCVCSMTSSLSPPPLEVVRVAEVGVDVVSWAEETRGQCTVRNLLWTAWLNALTPGAPFLWLCACVCAWLCMCVLDQLNFLSWDNQLHTSTWHNLSHVGIRVKNVFLDLKMSTPSVLHQENHHWSNDQPGSHLESCVCCLCVLNDLAVDPDAFEN